MEITEEQWAELMTAAGMKAGAIEALARRQGVLPELVVPAVSNVAVEGASPKVATTGSRAADKEEEVAAEKEDDDDA